MIIERTVTTTEGRFMSMVSSELRTCPKSPPVDNLVRHAACELLKADAWAPAIERRGSSPLEAAAPAGVQGPICARKRCSGQHSAAASGVMTDCQGKAWRDKAPQDKACQRIDQQVTRAMALPAPRCQAARTV